MLGALPRIVAFLVLKPLAHLAAVRVIRHAIDFVVGLSAFVTNAKDDVLARFAAIFVARAGVGHVEQGDAHVARQGREMACHLYADD